jgi:hypothetical protein
MKTEAEIRAALVDAFEQYRQPGTISVTFGGHRGKPSVDLKIEAMYESPRFKFGSLLGLAQFLADACGGTNVDIVDEFSSPGCETCDWGSSYGKTYRVW